MPITASPPAVEQAVDDARRHALRVVGRVVRLQAHRHRAGQPDGVAEALDDDALLRRQDEVLVAHQLGDRRRHLGRDAGGEGGERRGGGVARQQPVAELAHRHVRDRDEGRPVVAVEDEPRHLVLGIGHEHVVEEIGQRHVGEGEARRHHLLRRPGRDPGEEVAGAPRRRLGEQRLQAVEAPLGRPRPRPVGHRSRLLDPPRYPPGRHPPPARSGGACECGTDKSRPRTRRPRTRLPGLARLNLPARAWLPGLAGPDLPTPNLPTPNLPAPPTGALRANRRVRRPPRALLAPAGRADGASPKVCPTHAVRGKRSRRGPNAAAPRQPKPAAQGRRRVLPPESAAALDRTPRLGSYAGRERPRNAPAAPGYHPPGSR